MLKRLSEGLRGWKPGPAASQTDPIALLTAGWSEIVGPEVAGCSRPLHIGPDATLVIATRSSAWSHQLSLLAPQILQRIAARLPQPGGIERLRFRVGKLPAPDSGAAMRAARPRPGGSPARVPLEPGRPPAASAKEAMERFRAGVTARRRAKERAGAKECRRCGALVATVGRLCVRCGNAEADERYRRVARVLFDAPWLGYAGTAELVGGLTVEEYGAIRKRLLARWWGSLTRAAAAKRVARTERVIANSYVVLQSGLAPEAIVPAVIRNVLGDELYELIYKTD